MNLDTINNLLAVVIEKNDACAKFTTLHGAAISERAALIEGGDERAVKRLTAVAAEIEIYSRQAEKNRDANKQAFKELVGYCRELLEGDLAQIVIAKRTEIFHKATAAL